MEDAQLLSVDEHAKPNPKIEVIELLPDGTEIKAVWTFLQLENVAKLVTVHFLD